MGALVMFMQCGFGFLEAGTTRAKNVTNILIKNVLDLSKYLNLYCILKKFYCRWDLTKSDNNPWLNSNDRVTTVKVWSTANRQRSKFSSKIKILVKNWNFRQRSKFWSKIEILIKKKRNFDQKSKFSSKIEILVKNRNFRQKLKFW